MMDIYSKSFCKGYVIGIVFLVAAALLLGFAFGIDIPSGASFATVMVGCSMAANTYAANMKETPSSSLSWRYAWMWSLYAFIISIVFVVVIFLGAWAVFGSSAFNMFVNLNALFILIMLFLCIVIYLIVALMIRFSFPFFVKTQLKAIEKKNSK